MLHCNAFLLQLFTMFIDVRFGDYFTLLYKHQWKTGWALYENVLSSHVKKSPLQPNGYIVNLHFSSFTA